MENKNVQMQEEEKEKVIFTEPKAGLTAPLWVYELVDKFEEAVENHVNADHSQETGNIVWDVRQEIIQHLNKEK